MNDYKPNSHRFKEEQKEAPAQSEEKRIEKVVKGNVRTKKKSDISKVADVFISEDIHNVKSYILMDVLVPAIKKAVKDIVTDGIEMMLYGSTGRKDKKPGSNVSYARYYDRREDDRRSYDAPKARSRFDYDDIIFDNRGDAEAVLDQMQCVIDRYGFVTVADLYDMAVPDLTPPYTSNKYGWDTIRNAEAVRVRDGYILKLPRVTPRD